jgi:hypothetical protein
MAESSDSIESGGAGGSFTQSSILTPTLHTLGASPNTKYHQSSVGSSQGNGWQQLINET